MSERELLIDKIKKLMALNLEKQKEHQLKYNLPERCGCITRESVEIVRLLPKMQALGIHLIDCTT